MHNDLRSKLLQSRIADVELDRLLEYVACELARPAGVEVTVEIVLDSAGRLRRAYVKTGPFGREHLRR